MSIKDFQTLAKLGDGAYSSVWKVKRISDGQEYAMKKVKLITLSEKERQNALNEVRILASINNPYIVGYKEAFFEETPLTLCIVMEYAGGGDILNKITQHQKSHTHFKEDEIWRYSIQMIMGLKALHDMKILHRDLKCANLFLSTDGKAAKLGDLNVSKVTKDSMAYTQTGTPYYASPEVWRDQPYDMKSDIWSVGCVIYEMCALKPPFTANSMQGLYKKVQRGVFDRIPQQYSVDLYNLVSMCLKVKPSARPNCEELLAHPIVQKYGRKHVSDFNDGMDENNELLGTIRVPVNIKSVAKQLPKANYTKPAPSMELPRGRNNQLSVDIDSTRPTSQHAANAKEDILVRESQSRESKVSRMQAINGQNNQESEREYLRRIQKEHMERNHKPARRPDDSKDKKSSRVLDNVPKGTKSPQNRDPSGKRVMEDGKARYQAHMREMESVFNDQQTDSLNNLNHKPKVLERRRPEEQRGYGLGVPPVRQRPSSREYSYNDLGPEKNLINKQEYLINKYQNRGDHKHDEKKTMGRVESDKEQILKRRADYLIEKYQIGDSTKHTTKDSSDYIDRMERHAHANIFSSKDIAENPYERAQALLNKKVEYQYLNNNHNNVRAPSKNNYQYKLKDEPNQDSVRRQPVKEDRPAYKPVWWG